jgi:hypothetical protein
MNSPTQPYPFIFFPQFPGVISADILFAFTYRCTHYLLEKYELYYSALIPLYPFHQNDFLLAFQRIREQFKTKIKSDF